MRELNWTTFFALVDKIVDLPDKSAQEKADEFRQRCRDAGCEENWNELVGWFANDDEEPGDDDSNGPAQETPLTE